MENEYVCEQNETHQNAAMQIISKMPEDNLMSGLAELFKIFGDFTRLKILFVLMESDMCVCHIAQVLNMQQSAISHQLRILKQARLVKYRKEGKTVIYSLADSHIKNVFSQALEHVSE